MAKNPAFDYNNLFNKAKLYANRAMDEDRESDLFPFWLSLSLELLARSTLSKISPVLLADTSNNDGTNLLYALEFETTKKPKSITVLFVLERLTKIEIEFTKTEFDLSKLIIDQRNAELHSGLSGYLDFPVGLWLADYYRICKILLSAQQLSLKDFFGNSEAIAAEKMIEADAEKIKKGVLDNIQAYKKVFFGYPPEVQEQRIKNASNQDKLHKNAKTIVCPACGNNALIFGEFISVSDAKLSEGIIFQESRYLPTRLACFVCSLQINGYSELKAIDFGAQFSISEELDPVDYHDIDVEDYFIAHHDVNDFIARHMEDEYRDE
jgi:hypothetical protein